VVEAKYDGDYYPGHIEKLNNDGTYAVLYDTGDKEASVKRGLIKVAATSPASSPLSTQAGWNEHKEDETGDHTEGTADLDHPICGCSNAVPATEKYKRAPVGGLASGVEGRAVGAGMDGVDGTNLNIWLGKMQQMHRTNPGDTSLVGRLFVQLERLIAQQEQDRHAQHDAIISLTTDLFVNEKIAAAEGGIGSQAKQGSSSGRYREAAKQVQVHLCRRVFEQCILRLYTLQCASTRAHIVVLRPHH
jgi:hypothetical protein